MQDRIFYYICLNFTLVSLRKLLSSFLFIFNITIVCYSQQIQNFYLPDYYSSTALDHLALINPAWTADEKRATLNSLYKSRSGLFNEVATITAYGDVLLNSKSNVGQVARVLFQNEKEGPYISSPKFYGNYAVKIPLREDLFLSAGLALGVASISFTAPSGMGKGSAPDVNAGLILKYRKTEIGAASYQLLNNSITAINSPLLFKRFYQFYFQSEKDLSEYLTLRAHLFYRPQPYRDLGNAALLLCYKETIAFGGMYQYQRGTSFLASLYLNQSNNPIILNFSFNSLFLSNRLLTTGSYELGLQYRIAN